MIRCARAIGSGINARIGAIYRFNDAVRFGASIQTPTLMALSESYNSSLSASFDRPMTPQALAQAARDPMLRAQLYAAAAAAMGEIAPPERAWLDQFGTALKLDPAARASIESRLAG